MISVKTIDEAIVEAMTIGEWIIELPEGVTTQDIRTVEGDRLLTKKGESASITHYWTADVVDKLLDLRNECVLVSELGIVSDTETSVEALV